MKAIILSAGYGSRLSPLSDIIPKPMFPVLDRSIISLIIDNLRILGIDRIGVNTHHLPDKLGAHLLRIRPPGIEFYSIYEKDIRGTGGGIQGFRDFIGDDNFIVHNCDVISNAPLHDMIDFHNESGAIATIYLVDCKRHNSVAIDQGNNIVDIANKLETSSNNLLTHAGITVFSSEIFKYLPDTHRFSIIDILVELIRVKPGSIKYWIPEENAYWRDIGSIESYLDLHRDILSEHIAVHPSLRVPSESVFKGADVFIHAQASINGFVSIGHYCRIPKAAVIKDCVIWAGTSLPKAFRAENKIIYKDLIV